MVPFMLYGDVSARVGIPLAAPAGSQLAGTLALGGRYGPPFGVGSGVTGCGTGRPLRVDGRAVIPALIAGARHDAGTGPGDPATRDAGARAWLEAAQAECASVPTFLALARDLAAIGAPNALVSRSSPPRTRR